MKVSEFIHLLEQLPPDLELYNATGPSSWGELDLMDADSNFQCYVGRNPDDPGKMALIFHEHYATCQESKDWISLKAYTAHMKADKQQSIEYWQNAWEENRGAAIEIIAAFLSKDPSRAGHHLSDLRSYAAEMIGLAKRNEDWQSTVEEHQT